MIRSVLADTGPLYAAVDPDDTHHARARTELASLTSEGISILLAYPTLLESYSLVLRRLGVHDAHRWLTEIRKGVLLISPTTADYQAGAALVLSFRDQRFTLFDTVLAALSSRLNAPTWTYDHHFDLMRASIWQHSSG